MHRLRRHLTYANVMSTIAVALAIAGGSTAIALTASSKKPDVNSKGNIRSGRITTAKIANGAVTAAKIGQIQVVAATSSQTATVQCPVGERLTGGGADALGGGGVAVETSRPEGNGWFAGINAGTGIHDITAYAICLR